jgi:hypothetical protein
MKPMSLVSRLRSLMDMTPGQMLGRYELLVPIAQGGMAAVWAAEQRGPHGFRKTVAIKTMLPQISDDPRFEQMFLDEARVASRIRHPNVVEILDLGEHEDVLYLVMEWVDGESLGTVRRAAPDQRLPLPIATRIAADVCAGLHAAHELADEEGRPLSLVHRDVSPQNILVGYDGVVRITDFGVAKVAGRTSETTTLRRARGKPPYMAPEQARGRAIDRRADVFALGIVLYQMTTGRHPFRGETDVATLHNILGDQPIVLPRLFDPAFPESLERVIAGALARDPAERIGSAREVMLALDEVSQHEGWRVRSEDVERLVGELLAERGEERRSGIRAAIRDAEARAGDPESASVSARDVVSLPARSEESDTDAAASVGATARTSAGFPLTGSRRWLLALGALFAVGLGGALLGVYAARKGGDSPGGARSSSSSAAVVAAQSGDHSSPGIAMKSAELRDAREPPPASASAGQVSAGVSQPHLLLAKPRTTKDRTAGARRRATANASTVHPADTSDPFAPPPVSDPGF